MSRRCVFCFKEFMQNETYEEAHPWCVDELRNLPEVEPDVLEARRGVAARLALVSPGHPGSDSDFLSAILGELITIRVLLERRADAPYEEDYEEEP